LIDGEYDKDLFRVADALLQKGGEFLDVGANHGLLSFGLAQKLNDRVRFHLFEPNPKLLESIRKSLELYPSMVTEINPVAVCEKDATKCLGKMSEVARGGRTVLFVSHNMGSIASPCETAPLLQSGRIGAAGPTHRIIESYSSLSTRALRVAFPARADIPSIIGISLDEAALRRGDFSACIEFMSPYPLRPTRRRNRCVKHTGVPIWGRTEGFIQVIEEMFLRTAAY